MIRAFTFALIIAVVAFAYYAEIPYAELPAIKHAPYCPPVYYTFFVSDAGQVTRMVICMDDEGIAGGVN